MAETSRERERRESELWKAVLSELAAFRPQWLSGWGGYTLRPPGVTYGGSETFYTLEEGRAYAIAHEEKLRKEAEQQRREVFPVKNVLDAFQQQLVHG